MNDDERVKAHAIPDADVATCKMFFDATCALAEAMIALAKARDLIIMARGGTLAASTVHVLVQTAHGLLGDMGSELVATMHATTDPAVKTWIRLMLDRLHHQPGRATVPPDVAASSESHSESPSS